MKFTNGTASPVVSYAEMRSHLRLANDEERTLIEDVVAFATKAIEGDAEISIGQRTITATYFGTPDTPGHRHELPHGPVISVTSVTGGDSVQLAADKYTLEADGVIDFVRLKVIPVYPLTIVYSAGYATVPADLKHAIKLLAAHMFNHREDTTEKNTYTIPHGVLAVVDRYRRSRRIG